MGACIPTSCIICTDGVGSLGTREQQQEQLCLSHGSVPPGSLWSFPLFSKISLVRSFGQSGFGCGIGADEFDVTISTSTKRFCIGKILSFSAPTSIDENTHGHSLFSVCCAAIGDGLGPSNLVCAEPDTKVFHHPERDRNLFSSNSHFRLNRASGYVTLLASQTRCKMATLAAEASLPPAEIPLETIPWGMVR